MTISAVSLETLKAHLRVDADFEDALIETYGIAATELAEQILGREIVQEVDANALARSVDEVPKGVVAWICLYVNDLYSNRSLMDSGNSVKRHYDHLLDRFISFEGAR